MKPRILIIEDDVSLARILRDNLVADGFDVTCLFDGDVALTAAEADEVTADLVILDVTLPGSTGFEVCRALRRRGRTPIFLLTSHTNARDRRTAFSLGADAYITKPFDLEQLLARVHHVVWTPMAGAADERFDLEQVPESAGASQHLAG